MLSFATYCPFPYRNDAFKRHFSDSDVPLSDVDSELATVPSLGNLRQSISPLVWPVFIVVYCRLVLSSVTPVLFSLESHRLRDRKSVV